MQLAHAVLAGSMFPPIPSETEGDHGIGSPGPPPAIGDLLFRNTMVAPEKRSNQLRPRTLALPVSICQAASALRSSLAFLGHAALISS
jgi:hypothetical protein